MSIDKLAARIAAAEGKYETFRLAVLEWGNDIDTHSRLIDKLWQRVEALEAAQQPHQDKMDRLIALDRDDPAKDAAQQPPLFTAEEVARIVAPSSPDDSLIDRVAKAIYDAPNTHEGRRSEARAAILEVAAWLREQHGGDLIAATVLRREANQ